MPVTKEALIRLSEVAPQGLLELYTNRATGLPSLWVKRSFGLQVTLSSIANKAHMQLIEEIRALPWVESVQLILASDNIRVYVDSVEIDDCGTPCIHVEGVARDLPEAIIKATIKAFEVNV